MGELGSRSTGSRVDKERRPHTVDGGESSATNGQRKMSYFQRWRSDVIENRSTKNGQRRGSVQDSRVSETLRQPSIHSSPERQTSLRLRRSRFVSKERGAADEVPGSSSIGDDSTERRLGIQLRPEAGVLLCSDSSAIQKILPIQGGRRPLSIQRPTFRVEPQSLLLRQNNEGNSTYVEQTANFVDSVCRRLALCERQRQDTQRQSHSGDTVTRPRTGETSDERTVGACTKVRTPGSNDRFEAWISRTYRKGDRKAKQLYNEDLRTSQKVHEENRQETDSEVVIPGKNNTGDTRQIRVIGLSNGLDLVLTKRRIENLTIRLKFFIKVESF
eukprot:Awhi_evm1s9813